MINSSYPASLGNVVRSNGRGLNISAYARAIRAGVADILPSRHRRGATRNAAAACVAASTSTPIDGWTTRSGTRVGTYVCWPGRKAGPCPSTVSGRTSRDCPSTSVCRAIVDGTRRSSTWTSWPRKASPTPASYGSPNAAVPAAGGHWGSTVGDQARAIAGPQLDREQVLTSTCQALTEYGYEAHRDGATILLANCPFDALSQEHTELICGMNLAIMDAVTDRVGQTGLTARLEPAPDRCCVVLERGP